MENEVEKPHSLIHRLAWLIFGFLALPTVGAIFYIGYAFLNDAIESHRTHARDVVNQYKVIREYYTTNVVKRAIQNGKLSAKRNYQSDPDAIPIPATFIHELNGLLEKESRVSTKVRLFSNYPFPERIDRKLDDFELKALERLSKGETTTIEETEEIDGEEYFRFAIADKMNDVTCVECHNSVADSPKRDWALGDTRGALEVMIPIGNQIKSSETLARQTAAFTSLMIISLVLLVMIILRRSVKIPLDKLGASMAQVTKNGDFSQRIDVKSNDEIGLLSRQFNKMVIQLRSIKIALEHEKEAANEANRAKSRFLSAMSHDIRAPMNAILGVADILNDTDLSDEQRSYLRIFQRAGESLLVLINGILDLSKIESGHMEIEHIAFDLGDLVESISNLFCFKAKESKIDLKIHIAPDLSRNRLGDVHRIRQVLVNLVGNGIKFTEKGSVTISIQNSKPSKDQTETLLFQISDTGIGISKERLGLIFDDYKQADISTPRKYGGTGLGLGISKSLVELMGGEIWVETEVHVGTTFSFTLPLPSVEAQTGTVSQLSLPKENLSFLIGASNLQFYSGLKKHLERSSATVDIVDHADLLASKIATKSYSMIFLDTELTSSFGDFFMRLRMQKGAGNIPIITFSDPSSIMPYVPMNPVVAHFSKDIEYEELSIPMKNLMHRSKHGVVLVVEDDDFLRKTIEETISTDLNMKVITAKDGGEAINKFSPDVHTIVSDLKMKEVDGLELLNRIRQMDPQIPFILLSGFVNTELALKVFRAGANEILEKPFNPNNLKRSILFPPGMKRTTFRKEQVQRSTRKILLVDDSVDNRLIVKAFLKDMPVSITEATNGREALERFKEDRFDLVLMDIQMPVLNGYDSTRQIRQWEIEQNRTRTPIIALTAAAMDHEIRECLNCGCDLTMTKPIRKNILIDMIENQFSLLQLKKVA